MIKVALLALDGYTDSGLSIALDVFRATNALGARSGRGQPFAVEVLSPTRVVVAASGLRTTVHGGLSRLSRCDVVLVPGCWTEGDDDVTRLLARTDVQASIRALDRAWARGALIGASCSGAFVLASTGHLVRATTTWWLAEGFRRRFPGVQLDVEEALVAHDRLICAGTVFAMADLALHVVALEVGPTLADGCMRALLLDRHASQAPYMVLRQMAADDPVVQAAERWARRHLVESFSVARLAKAVGTSARTLARRLHETLGLSPLGFVQRIRLEVATHLLESSSVSLEQVAERVGYRNAGTLRRLMQRELGAAPGALRRARPSGARPREGARR